MKKVTDFLEKNFALILTAIFLIAAGFIISHHEFWRDETQPWLIARDSPSIWSLFKNLKYEGHPALWYLVMMLGSKITHSPEIIKLLHLLTAAGAVFIFAQYAPFPKFIKILFTFGYFPFYEYAIISRNYAIGLFFLFLFCALFKERLKNFLWPALALFFLANTRVLFLIITLAISAVLLAEFIFNHRDLAPSQKKKFYLGLLVIFLGVVISVIQIFPPKDSWAINLTQNINWQNIYQRLNLISIVFLPLPKSILNFWNTSFINYLPQPLAYIIEYGISIFIIIWIYLILVSRPLVFFFYLGSWLGILSLLSIRYHGNLRQPGIFFIVFICALWLAEHYQEIKINKFLAGLSVFFRKHLLFLLTIILLFQLAGGILAAYADYLFPFSNAQAASLFLKEEFKDKKFILVSEEKFSPQTIISYLNSKVYFPGRREFGSFNLNNVYLGRPIQPIRNILETAREMAQKYQEDVVISLSFPLKQVFVEQQDFEGKTTDFLIIWTSLLQNQYVRPFKVRNSPLIIGTICEKFKQLKNASELKIDPALSSQKQIIFNILKDACRNIFTRYSMEKIGEFDTAAVVRIEVYYLYLIKKYPETVSSRGPLITGKN